MEGGSCVAVALNYDDNAATVSGMFITDTGEVLLYLLSGGG